MKVIFLDRDGTIIAEPPDEQVDSLEKLEIIPGVIQGLRLLQNRGYVLVLVSNQDNLGSAAYPMNTYEIVQNKLMGCLNGEGIRFNAVFICPHNKTDHCTCRKPKTGLIDEFIRMNKVDLSRSFVFGDRETDVQLAHNIGCKAVRLTSDISTSADIKNDNFLDACRSIVRSDRSANLNRNTTETKISVEVCLDGMGVYKINSGIGFFDHMLSLLSKHSGIDMNIELQGDLHVDEHHLVGEVHLILLHRSQFHIHSEASLGDDLNYVSQVRWGVVLDPRLLRPRHVVRPEQALENHRKFHTGTRVGRAELFPHRHVEHSTQHPEFLVHRGWFYGPKFGDARLPADTLLLLEPTTQMNFDFCGVNVCELDRSKHGFERFQRVLVSFVRCLCPNRRLGVVLQEKIRPFAKRQFSTLADCIKGVVVSGGQAFAHLLLRLVPVGCVG